MGRAWRRPAAGALLVLGGCALHPSEFQATLADGKDGATVTVELEGADQLSLLDLSRKIEDLMLELSRQPDRNGPAFDAAQELLDLYLSEGFADARVDHEVERQQQEGAPPKVRVRFRIAEGPMVVVEEVTIAGNAAIPTDELLPLWSRRQSGLLGFGDPLFVLAELQELAEAIRAAYVARGWFEATVAGPEVVRSEDGSRVKVAFRVEEGPLYTLGAVTVDEALVAALGEAAPPLPKPQPFAWTVIDDYVREVRRRLRESGHHEPRVLRPVLAQDRERRVIDVQVGGVPGKRVRVGEVVVRGNEKTSASVILGKLDFEPGDPYAGSREDRALRRLYESGLFRRVEIVHEPIEGDDERIRLVIAVEEAETAAVEVRAGYGTYEKLRGGVRLEENNLFGTGRRGSVEGLVHTKGFKTGASLTDPDLLFSETALTLSGTMFRREEPSYEDRAVGGTASLQREIVAKATARTGYTYEHRTGARVDAVDPSTTDPDYDKGFLFLEVGRDRRDSPLFPRRGHQEVVSLDWASQGLGGEIDFVRLRVRGSAYWRAAERLVLVARGDAGWLWPQAGADTVPIQERFFNGGDSTVRSFRESQLGPKDANGQPIGGEYRNVLNLEARYTLVHPLEAAVFFDMGNVGRNVADYGLSDLHYGIGAGLGYGLPIGPIRFDAAWNPDRDPGDEAWVLHLTVGHPF